MSPYLNVFVPCLLFEGLLDELKHFDRIIIDISQFKCALLDHVIAQDVFDEALDERQLAQNHFQHPKCLVHAFVVAIDAP